MHRHEHINITTDQWSSWRSGSFELLNTVVIMVFGYVVDVLVHSDIINAKRLFVRPLTIIIILQSYQITLITYINYVLHTHKHLQNYSYSTTHGMVKKMCTLPSIYNPSAGYKQDMNGLQSQSLEECIAFLLWRKTCGCVWEVGCNSHWG